MIMESPLKESDLKTINKSLYLLNELIEAIEKAECAGIDCTEQKLRRDDLTQKLLAIKNAYFPGR
ncbi:hypothetical protein EBT31_12185 [bacterium]|jgi:hypothetical protein|nr:hypothetical protein [bacterium]NBX50759.1 hypothetical protein [bacterium]